MYIQTEGSYLSFSRESGKVEEVGINLFDCFRSDLTHRATLFHLCQGDVGNTDVSSVETKSTVHQSGKRLNQHLATRITKRFLD